MKFSPVAIISLLAVATADGIVGRRCNRDSDCASKRCSSMRKICEPKLENGESCNKDSDCITNKCKFFKCVRTKCSGVDGLQAIWSKKMVEIMYYGKEISVTSRKLLEQLDHATIFLLSLIVTATLSEEPIDHTHISTTEVDLGWSKDDNAGFTGPWTKVLPDTTEMKVSDNYSVTLFLEDDFFGGHPDDDSKLDKLGDALRSATQNPILSPLTDTTTYVKSKVIFETLAKDTQINYAKDGGAIPDTYNEVPYTNSDESFSRYFFYGPFGVPLIAAQENTSNDSELGPFVVDVPLQNYETRERYRPLGARVHFDENQKVTGIFDHYKNKLYVPGDQGWDKAKFLARVSAFVLVTVREHLVWTHLSLAQQTTLHSTVLLSPEHPLRRLLTIHTYRTNTINTDSFFGLVPELSTLHRAVGFTYEALKEIFDFSLETSNIYEPFENRKVNSALKVLVDKGKFPFISEGMEYYKIVKTFVTSWLTEVGDAAKDSQALDFYEAMKDSTKKMKYKIPEYSGNDSMIDLVTQIIFTVTAWHEVVGYVRDAPYPDDISFRVSKNCDKESSDLQSFIYYSAIAACTSLRMPFLLRDYPNFFGAGGAPAWERTIWDKFVEDLKVQSNKVKEADKIRMEDPLSHEFKHMDPGRFECSVSV